MPGKGITSRAVTGPTHMRGVWDAASIAPGRVARSPDGVAGTGVGVARPRTDQAGH